MKNRQWEQSLKYFQYLWLEKEVLTQHGTRTGHPHWPLEMSRPGK